MHSQSRKRLPAFAIVACAAGLTLLFALPVAATTFYVSPSGSSANNGRTTTSPWSLAQANASLRGGDVCVMLPGNYGSVTIAPANSGMLGQAITYVGDLRNPYAATMASIEIH